MTLLRSIRAMAAVAAVGLATALALLAGLVAPAAQAAPRTAAGVPPGGAWVRVAHFVPGMGSASVDLKPVGGAAESMTPARGVTYGAVSDYQKIAPGSYTATVRSSSDAAGAAPLLSSSFEVSAGQARTIAVVGTAAEPRLALLTDDLTPPSSDAVRVRVLQASQSDAVTVTARGGPVVGQQIVLGQSTGYTTVPAGSWRLRLQGDTAAPTRQAVSLASGSIYTIVVLGDGDGVRLKVVTDAAGAVTAPRGGAHTGGGGTAPGRLPGHLAAAPASTASAATVTSVTFWSVAFAGLVVLLSSLALVRRRARPRTGR